MKKCRRKTPHVFHVETRQPTIKAMAPVAWSSQVQAQVKIHVAMTLPEVLLAGKDPIATQWLQSLLDGLDNGTNHKQTLQIWQTLTARHCQSKDGAGFAMGQVTVEQILYVQIRKNKMKMEKKCWMLCAKGMPRVKDMCHRKNQKK